jgi:hypothetical protein
VGDAMTATLNGQRAEMIDLYSHCIPECDWGDCEGEHGDYCDRMQGGRANGVTEPFWVRSEFWCSVIRSYITGTVTREHFKDCERNRDGVQLSVNVFGEIPVSSPSGEYQEVKFNLTPGEARQLAATLIAAADDHDRRP